MTLNFFKPLINNDLLLFRLSTMDLRKRVLTKMIDSDMKRIFYKSMGMIFLAKGFSVASPWCLKLVIDSMTVTS